MEALTTLEINEILKNNPVTRKKFVGTFPACIIPMPGKNEYSFVSNTDSHDKPGEHWNSWVVNKDTVHFFDSFGRDIRDPTLPDYYRDFAIGFNRVVCNTQQIQHFQSITCGYFCVHFIYIISLGMNLKHFLSDYSQDLKSNDAIVYDIVNSIVY